MSQNNEMNQAAARSLGSENSYAVYTDTYNPSLLNPMPRSAARQDWDIKGDEFVGYDVWHCHEATFLLNNGLPVAGTLKIICPASSKYMVESKSFKLYLNSFDMCKMGATIEEAIRNYEMQVAKDVSVCIDDHVEVCFFSSGEDLGSVDPMEYYDDLSFRLPKQELEAAEFTDYSGQQTHFQVVDVDKPGERVQVFTNVLRSRCRHTKQKDTGAAYFDIETRKGYVDLLSLLKEVISLREVNEFHEFCSEKLYKTIMSNPYVDKCTVTLLYSRRGSLDINPTRSTTRRRIPRDLVDPTVYTKKAMGQ